ncbi:hypothetical protein ACA910_018843 [Epithemia clementina (nom. ined.)]
MQSRLQQSQEQQAASHWQPQQQQQAQQQHRINPYPQSSSLPHSNSHARSLSSSALQSHQHHHASSSSSREQQQERCLALEALEKDAAKVWPELPDCYRNDKECILRALLKSPTLPPKSDFERQFDKHLRLDKQVILAFCQRPDFAQLYADRLLFVPDCYKHDKDVMLAYCAKIPRSLQDCSEALRQDVDVVQAAISLDGLELQYASPVLLQNNRELVLAACQKSGRALEFCPPGPLRDEFTHNRDFMLHTILKQPHAGPMFRLLPPTLQKDAELVLQALTNGMRFRYCPVELQQNIHGFVLEALRRRADLYLELPQSIQQQRHVCLAALTSDTLTTAVLQKGLHHHAHLAVEQAAVALQLCHCAEASVVQQFIVEQAPPRFKDDFEIMLAAIQRCAKLFAHASPRLQREPRIIMAALDADSAADVLSAVGHEALLAHPPIVVRAIQVSQKRHLRLLRTHIPPDLWMNRDVAQAYIQCSNRVLDPMEPLLQHDEELALCVAEFAGPDFGRVGEGLRGNLEFMKRAVDHNGLVLRYAVPALRDSSMELAVRALANHAQALHRSSGCRLTRDQVATHVQAKLALQATFVQDFLRGIAIVRYPHLPPAQRSTLSMLDRGVETSQAFKQLIAEFLGVPIGVELRILRKASVNLVASPSTSSNNHNHAPSDHPADRHNPELYRMDRWMRHRLPRRRHVVLRQQQQQQQQQQNVDAPNNNNNINNDFDDLDDEFDFVFMHHGPRRGGRFRGPANEEEGDAAAWEMGLFGWRPGDRLDEFANRVPGEDDEDRAMNGVEPQRPADAADIPPPNRAADAAVAAAFAPPAWAPQHRDGWRGGPHNNNNNNNPDNDRHGYLPNERPRHRVARPYGFDARRGRGYLERRHPHDVHRLENPEALEDREMGRRLDYDRFPERPSQHHDGGGGGGLRREGAPARDPPHHLLDDPALERARNHRLPVDMRAPAHEGERYVYQERPPNYQRYRLHENDYERPGQGQASAAAAAQDHQAAGFDQRRRRRYRAQEHDHEHSMAEFLHDDEDAEDDPFANNNRLRAPLQAPAPMMMMGDDMMEVHLDFDLWPADQEQQERGGLGGDENRRDHVARAAVGGFSQRQDAEESVANLAEMGF